MALRSQAAPPISMNFSHSASLKRTYRAFRGAGGFGLGMFKYSFMLVGLSFLGAGECAKLFVSKVFLRFELVAWVLCAEVGVSHKDAWALHLCKFFPWVEN